MLRNYLAKLSDAELRAALPEILEILNTAQWKALKDCVLTEMTRRGE